MSFAKLEKSGSQPTFKSRNTSWLKGDIDVICIVVIRNVFICSQMSMFLITQKPADITETVQSRCGDKVIKWNERYNACLKGIKY